MAQWTCTICYHGFDARSRPESCPECGSSPYSIVELPAEGTTVKPGQYVGVPGSLDEVRNRARIRMKGICAAYPWCDGADDRVCNREAYGAPIGMGGVGTGTSFANNVQALTKLQLKMQVVGEHFVPSATTNFLGLELSFPIMGASTSGIASYTTEIDENDFCRAAIRGCREAGTISWRGDTHFYTEENHPGLNAIEKEQGFGIPIFKPRHQDVLKRLIARAEAMGCPAVGVDLDGCGSTNMARGGQPVFRKSPEDIRELVSSTRLPFICKGIMHPEDALACVEAGAKVIAVSNHGGRVLDGSPGVAEVLPSIVEAVGDSVIITADGGVRTGFDALKMLALGADAVLVGRDVIRAAVGGGSYGVAMQMKRFDAVLRRAMLMTGCPDTGSIDTSILV